MMETFTKKKPINEIFAENLSLKNWVNESVVPNAKFQVIDDELMRQKEQHLTTMVHCLSLSIMELVLNCFTDSPNERMSMKDVIAALIKIKF